MTTSLVFGAAGGVGLAVAHALVERGHIVIGTVLNDAEESLLRENVPKVSQIYHVDFGSADGVLKQSAEIAAALPRLDHVVVCAAISPLSPVETGSLEQLRRTLEINTVSHVAIYQGVMPRLRESKGRLLFISSMSGKLALPFIGAYTASKFALEGIADVMRMEAGRFGVEVILVEPGGIRTPMVTGQLAQVERAIAALDPDTDEKFGYMYRGFQTAASRSYHGGGGSSPEQVAAVIVEGLEAAEPKPRYIAGEDAAQLLGARHSMSDREFDAMIQQFFSVD